MSAPTVHQRDDLLIRRLKNGEISAFRMVYDNCWKDLYIHAYRRLESADLAEELVQDLFVEFWERRDQLEITRSLEGYLYGVLKKKLLLHFRKQYTARSHQEALLHSGISADASLERRIIQRNLLERIDQLIVQLPKKTRLVFELSRKEFLSNKEIALQLNISSKTVEYHIDYALKFLREHCPEYASIHVLFILVFQ